MVACVEKVIWKRIPDINGDGRPDWKKYGRCSPDEVEFFLQGTGKNRFYLEPSRRNPNHFTISHGSSVVTPKGKQFSIGDVVSFNNGQNSGPIYKFTFDLHMPDGALLRSGLSVWNMALSFDDITLEYSNDDLERYSQSETKRLSKPLEARFANEMKERRAIRDARDPSTQQQLRRDVIEEAMETAIYCTTHFAPYIREVEARIAEYLLNTFGLRGDYYRNLL